jgi:hypothetical protein
MSNPHESGAYVTFYMDAVEIKSESEKAGRPIFKDVAHIRKIIPGDATNIVERVAKDFDKQQHPKEWASFEAQGATEHSGMPLEQWPQITRAQVKEAKYFEVHTVEQMAGLSDLHCQKLGMGFMELRNKAKAYIDAANGTAAQTAQAAENQRLRDEMDALKAQLAEIAPKRGRPAKVAEEVA